MELQRVRHDWVTELNWQLTQLDLEIIILTEVSQIKTTIIWYCLSMESKKIYGYGGEEGSEEINWEIRTDIYTFSSVTQSCPTLQPHRLRHTRLPRPSRSPRACSNSCRLSWRCYLTVSTSSPFLLLPSIFPSTTPSVFPNVSALHIRWPKCWIFSFSISSSNEYSGLISFRIDWFDLLEV